MKSRRRLDFCIDFTIQSVIGFECVALIFLAVFLLLYLVAVAAINLGLAWVRLLIEGDF